MTQYNVDRDGYESGDSVRAATYLAGYHKLVCFMRSLYGPVLTYYRAVGFN
jgi:hypothetical protein